MRYQQMQFGFGRPWTPMVRNLIIATGAIFLFQTFDRSGRLLEYLALDSAEVFGGLRLWQPLTYLFLHGGPLHLFFNLFALWMFGSELEEYLGPREFLFYYLFCGVGAGFLVVGLDAALGRHSLTVGASGAIYGLLLAYGVLWARRSITLLVFLVLPVTLEARIFVIVFAACEFFAGIGGSTSPVAHFAHLGGMGFGFLYLKLLRGRVRPLLHGKSVLSSLFAGSGMTDRERLDQLLDKVNRYGIHTLTDKERRFLDKMSRWGH
jgi:membrane associated rhomboid family serine protease